MRRIGRAKALRVSSACGWAHSVGGIEFRILCLSPLLIWITLRIMRTNKDISFKCSVYIKSALLLLLTGHSGTLLYKIMYYHYSTNKSSPMVCNQPGPQNAQNCFENIGFWSLSNDQVGIYIGAERLCIKKPSPGRF